MLWESKKLFGLYPHDIIKNCELTEGLAKPVSLCISRHVKWSDDDMCKLEPGVEVIMKDFAGPCVIWDQKRCFCYILNHFEYESDTLEKQYRRDFNNGSPDGSPVQIPENYYPNNDPNQQVNNSWNKNGVIFLNNWISKIVERNKKQSFRNFGPKDFE